MLLENESVKEYFEKHPEAVAIVEDFDFQTDCWRPEFTDESQYYRKATVDDVRRISFGGFCGEPGVFAWMYPCGVPTYVWIGEMGGIDPESVRVYVRFDDAEEAYRKFKQSMYDHEFGYEPDDWSVLLNFGSCPDGYNRQEWMESWGYGPEIVDAYERARHDVLAENGWYAE